MCQMVKCVASSLWCQDWLFGHKFIDISSAAKSSEMNYMGLLNWDIILGHCV
jgi:hypothetical protein